MQHGSSVPSRPSARLAAGVLAGERDGAEAITRQEGVASKVLVDIAGRPMLQRVLDAVAEAGAAPIYLCGPEQGTLTQEPWIRRPIHGATVHWLPPEASPARSAGALVDMAFGRDSHRTDGLLLTTGDHPLLTSATLGRFAAAAFAAEAEVVVGLARHARVQAAFPHSRRTPLKFSDGPFCGCNLFFVRSAAGRPVFDFWKQVESDRKRPGRMLQKIGFGFSLAYLSGRLSSAAALRKLSKVIGVSIGVVEISDPDAAVDVDSLADLETVRRRWRERSAAGATGPGCAS